MAPEVAPYGRKTQKAPAFQMSTLFGSQQGWAAMVIRFP